MEWETLISLKKQVERESEPKEFEQYPIPELEKDYQSIISSSAFRRLQDKTQVFPLDKSDFVRTRLTHSIEVSTIARQLGIMITNNNTQYLQQEFKNNEKLKEQIPIILSCAGLLHDIGNPPFGHFGEVVIGDWFKTEFDNKDFLYRGKRVRDILSEQMKKDLENFEGNAQALRILSKARNNVAGHNVNLSYGVLNTLIKYPTSSMEFSVRDIDIKKHKIGYYLSEEKVMSQICKETGTEVNGEFVRHPLVYLMEAADDIAYATADLEDALKKGLFTLTQFVEYYEIEINKTYGNQNQKYSIKLLEKLKKRMHETDRKKETDVIEFQKWMELVRKWLMYVVAYRFSKSYDKIMNGTYKFDLFYDTFHTVTIKILKGAMSRFVYNNREILKLELAAKKIIGSLLDDLIYAVLYFDINDSEYKPSKADKKTIDLISENYKEDYFHAKTEDEYYNLYLRFLMVTDYISGMTDSYAKNLYQEINGIN